MMKDDDFKLLRGFGDGRTNEQTFVIVESLSQLKTLSFTITLHLAISDILVQKLKLFVFYMMLNSQVLIFSVAKATLHSQMSVR